MEIQSEKKISYVQARKEYVSSLAPLDFTCNSVYTFVTGYRQQKLLTHPADHKYKLRHHLRYEQFYDRVAAIFDDVIPGKCTRWRMSTRVMNSVLVTQDLEFLQSCRSFERTVGALISSNIKTTCFSRGSDMLSTFMAS
uniref:Uncharacterized protein n=1 Tax=Timema bartmani TaxID=61472 RepID=A0A7R9F4Z1_9NEOP|nr:unnamed protein product [Timema bartmani]